MTRRLSARRTHAAVVAALDHASALPDFGRRLLMSGKGSELRGDRREVWLCKHVVEYLRRDRLRCEPECALGEGGRADIAVFDARSELTCVIEGKLYFTHHCRAGRGHRFIRNTGNDFLKRLWFAPRQQAIVFGVEYVAMPAAEAASSLYQARAIRRALERDRVPPLARFERDLRGAFAELCTVFPSVAASNPTWTAEHDGAKARLRAWVLALRPDVTATALVRVLPSI